MSCTRRTYLVGAMLLASVLTSDLLQAQSTGRPAAARQEAARTDTTRQPVDVRSADLLEREIVDGEAVRRLVGNVHLVQGETFLWADQARQYEARDEIVFEGNVRIVERGDSLAAAYVLYDSNTKVGRARGDVVLTDGEVEVFAPSGLYFTDEKRARFEDGVTLVDSASTLTSRGGIYWSDEKRAEFYDDVRLDSDETDLEADSVTYYRETEVSVARGDVFIERLGSGDDAAEDAAPDSLGRGLLFGDRAYSDEPNDLSQVDGDALLVQLRVDTTQTPAPIDTLLVRADRLIASRLDSLQRLIAVGNVVLWQRDFAALADSAVYDRIRYDVTDSTGQVVEEVLQEEVRLFKNPIGWFEETQVTGDTLRITRRGGQVDSLFVRNRAFVAQRDTALQRIQQLQGRHLVGLFREDSLRSLDVGPNAEAIYYLAEDGRANGGVQVSGDRIIFQFEGGDLRRIRDLGGIEGTYYPEDLLPASFELGGYRWEPERRPDVETWLQAERVQLRLAAALEQLHRLAGSPPEPPPPSPDQSSR